MYTVELQWLEHFLYHESMFETGVVRADEVNHSARPGSIIGIFFSIFFNMKICCVFSLESPLKGDSNEYKQHTSINIIKKMTLNCSKYNNVCSCWNVFLGTQDRVRNSRDKRAISVRANEL